MRRLALIIGVRVTDQRTRLIEARRAAQQAQAADDPWAAAAAWERYRLIEDAMRDPQERLDQGIALSKTAIALWMTSRPS